MSSQQHRHRHQHHINNYNFLESWFLPLLAAAVAAVVLLDEARRCSYWTLVPQQRCTMWQARRPGPTCELLRETYYLHIRDVKCFGTAANSVSCSTTLAKPSQ